MDMLISFWPLSLHVFKSPGVSMSAEETDASKFWLVVRCVNCLELTWFWRMAEGPPAKILDGVYISRMVW